MAERGQGTVEWVGLLSVVSLAMIALCASGMRVPGTGLARAVASRILCAASLADGCGDEPALIAAYGDEVGRLIRRHMPMLGFENGSRALPVDFRRCRSSACADGSARGLVHRSDARLPVTSFVHVVDCREGEAEATEAEGADCSGERAGNLYIQYWTYYADSATLRGVPVAGERGYHRDDWEGVQLRIGADGRIEQRASSHNGFNYARSRANWGADAGIGPLEGCGRGARSAVPQRLGAGDPPPPGLGRQPRGQRRWHSRHRPPHPGPPRAPGCSGADRRPRRPLPLRDLTALAEARLAGSRGRGDQLRETRRHVYHLLRGKRRPRWRV